MTRPPARSGKPPSSIGTSAARSGSVPIDAGLGIPSPWDESVPAIDAEGIVKALNKLKSKGLPATPRTAGQLLDLRSVYARASHPYDPQSRATALNQLLVRLLAEWDGDEGEAARVVFGVAAGTRGTTLTQRRDRARAILAYEQSHFRQVVEPSLIGQLANDVYADLLRYKRRIRRSAHSEEPTGDTPSLSDADVTHEEELISRIWQHVYGLRAELIATARLGLDPAMASQAEEHRQAAEREQKAVDELKAEYLTTYGTELIRHGEAEYWVG
jgi:hypothetical protein